MLNQLDYAPPSFSAANSKVKATGAATARTLPDHFADELSVKDFGAVGDGSTDDTAAIQAALSSAAKGITFPSGYTFKSGPLTCSVSKWLRVDGVLKMKDSTGTLLTLTGDQFTVCGNGEIDLNQTQFIGISVTGDRFALEGSLLIHNMLGGAASTGDSAAVVLENCTKPVINGVRFKNILHGTAPNDSQPRAITIGNTTDFYVDAYFHSVNTGVAVDACNRGVIRGDVYGGGVTNDNAFYIINSGDISIEDVVIDEWNGEPIVHSTVTNCQVLGVVQRNCTGNANGFENSTDITYRGCAFCGDNVAGVLKSRTANTTSTTVRILDCRIAVKSTQEVVSFFNGDVNDFVMIGCLTEVTNDTSKTFGGKFLRLQSTDAYVIDNNTWIFKEAAAAAASDFTIELSNTGYSSFKQNRLINRTASGRFRVNGIGSLVAVDDLHKQQNISAFRNADYGLSVSEPKRAFGVGAPSAGTFNPGDIVWDTAPAAGGTVGWICTTAGTPGTWKAFGAVAA